MTKAIGTWEEADAMKVHIEVFDENGNQWGGGWDACCSADLFARPDELRQFVAERCQYVPMPKRGHVFIAVDAKLGRIFHRLYSIEDLMCARA